MATSVLTINGTAYNQSARASSKYLIDGFGWDLDSAGYWLRFHEYQAGTQPSITGPKPVSLAINSTTVFTGDILGVEPAWDETGRVWTYSCAGLEYRANWIPVTAVDGSGLMRFNVDPQNVDYYVASQAGRSVGQILTTVLTNHSGALSAQGITTDATTTTELSALTLVPNSEVQIAGPRLWAAIQGFLSQWARNIRPMITAGGLVRFIDVTTGTAHTLTVGTDPIDPPLFRRNWATSATRVVARGQGNIGGAYVSVLKGSLTPAWNTTEQNAWTYSDFTNPTGPSADNGTVVSITSSTTATISSSDASRTWAANYWSGIQAQMVLLNSAGSGTTWTESRRVTANGSLTAGGSCSVTFDYALENSGASAYNSYVMIGTNVPLASGGLYDVWRLYNVTDPGSYVGAHLVTRFPVPVPFYGIQGSSVALTQTPVSQIVGPNTTFPAPFQVLPQTGQILFLRPVVEQVNSVAVLNAGGTHVTAPTDVYCLLAYSRGALTSPYPADVGGVAQYSGTAYSAAGLSRSLYVDLYDWRYGGNSSVVNGLSQMVQVSLRNTLVEGTIVYKGAYLTTQDPSGGHLINIAGNGYTTGDESLNVPVRSYALQYQTTGGGLNYITHLGCSSRQDPRTGESFFARFSPPGGGRLGFAATAGGMGFGAGAPIDLVGSGFPHAGGGDGFASFGFGDEPEAPRRPPNATVRPRRLTDQQRAIRAQENAVRDAEAAFERQQRERQEGEERREAAPRRAEDKRLQDQQRKVAEAEAAFERQQQARQKDEERSQRLAEATQKRSEREAKDREGRVFRTAEGPGFAAGEAVAGADDAHFGDPSGPIVGGGGGG